MRNLLLWLLIFSSFWGNAAPTLKPNAPERYTVKPGDTLWEIANRYLEHPWEWPELLKNNPQFKNSNQLYPGAILILGYREKQPYLKIIVNKTIKLSPTIREETPGQAIPPVHLSDIKPFLNSSLVLDEDLLVHSPYVIALKTEHLLGGQGDEVYVKNLCHLPEPCGHGNYSYSLFRPGGPYIDPITKNVLGYYASIVGYGALSRAGDPATIVLTDIVQGIKRRDKVIGNNEPDFNLDFQPKAPYMPVKALIIDMLSDYTQGAETLGVVINRGKDIGLVPGDVLAVFAPPRPIRDLECPYDCVRIPPERLGEIMIVRTFTHTSFALVMRSTRSVKLGDRATNP